MPGSRKIVGFSLIELMIALVIASLLAAVHIQRTTYDRDE